MPASDPLLTRYPTLGYLTRRQPPGTGTMPGADLADFLEAEGAVAG
jgi:hypothetical protein